MKQKVICFNNVPTYEYIQNCYSAKLVHKCKKGREKNQPKIILKKKTFQTDLILVISLKIWVTYLLVLCQKECLFSTIFSLHFSLALCMNVCCVPSTHSKMLFFLLMAYTIALEQNKIYMKKPFLST